MIEIVEFIKENFKVIIIIVIVLLFLLVLINIKGLNLNEKKIESKLVQKVTVETFDSSIDSQINSQIDNNLDKIMGKTNTFCESYLENSGELEKACEQLTKSNCANVTCCVFNNGKCAAGDINGPTYKTDKDGNLITMDSYYYLGKKMSHTM